MATGQALHGAVGKAANFGIIAAFSAFAAFPFAWMLITTFKRTGDLLDPSHNPFSYSLARLTGAVGEQLGVMMFLTYLVPPTSLFIPLSRVVSILHLQDSPFALVLVYPSFTIPFCTWLLMGFFKVIPKDVEEAAMIDGLSRFGAFVRVILPMSVAGLLTVVIFTFTLVLQEFVYALTFISSAKNFTVSVGVPSFLVRGDVYFWGSLMAACFIASVPIAFLYNLFVVLIDAAST